MDIKVPDSQTGFLDKWTAGQYASELSCFSNILAEARQVCSRVSGGQRDDCVGHYLVGDAYLLLPSTLEPFTRSYEVQGTCSQLYNVNTSRNIVWIPLAPNTSLRSVTVDENNRETPTEHNYQGACSMATLYFDSSCRTISTSGEYRCRV